MLEDAVLEDAWKWVPQSRSAQNAVDLHIVKQLAVPKCMAEMMMICVQLCGRDHSGLCLCMLHSDVATAESLAACSR